MFVGRCFIQVGSDLTRKLYTRLEKLSGNTDSSLLRTLANYDDKKYYNIGPGANVIKLSLSVIYEFS